MDSPSTLNTTHHKNTILLQRNGSSNMMMRMASSGTTRTGPSLLSAVETSTESCSVPNSASEDPSSDSTYRHAYVAVSTDENPVTSSVMFSVSGLDRKDITKDTPCLRPEGRDVAQKISFTTKRPPSTTQMTQAEAVVQMPQHLPRADDAQECRDESSIRRQEEYACDQSDVDTPTSSSLSPETTRPRLTLSAFRRPEHTVRMTESDASRSLSAEYDLHSEECRILGHGASSTVRLAVRRCDGEQVAVKRIAKHDALRRRRVRRGHRRHLDEWEILRSLAGSPGVVSLLDVFETDEEIQLVMEYCQGGELFDAIQKQKCRQSRRGRYCETQAASITSQLLWALSHLHSRGIVHRDVKPENILLMNRNDANVRVKLSDFGLARQLSTEEEDSDASSSDGEASPYTPLSRSRAYSCVGTDYYAAPEVCAGEGYDTSVDVYSLGVTLYVLLCGCPPSYTSDLNTVVEDSDSDDDFCSVEFPASHWKDVSFSAKELIRSMLHPDPARRISAQDALKHEWIVRNAQCNNAASMPSRPILDLELVRNRLYKKMNRLSADEKKGRTKRPAFSSGRSKKRRRVGEPRKSGSSSLMAAVAMADLYRGVASAAASASAAAAGVVYDEYKEEVKIVDDDHVVVESEFPVTALSV